MVEVPTKFTKDITYNDNVRASYNYNVQSSQYEVVPFEITKKHNIGEINIKKGMDNHTFKGDLRISSKFE